MNATLSLTTTSLDLARAEMERMARAALRPESARGWWHAARIVRTFCDAGRAMRQQAQMARFFAKSLPEKSAAYREAMRILARHTGEPIAADEAPGCGLFQGFPDGDEEGVAVTAARSASMKKRKRERKEGRGSGSIGWVVSGNERGPVVVAGSRGVSHSSYRSRSSLRGADLFLTEFIPFIGG